VVFVTGGEEVEIVVSVGSERGDFEGRLDISRGVDEGSSSCRVDCWGCWGISCAAERVAGAGSDGGWTVVESGVGLIVDLGEPGDSVTEQQKTEIERVTSKTSQDSCGLMRQSVDEMIFEDR